MSATIANLARKAPRKKLWPILAQNLLKVPCWKELVGNETLVVLKDDLTSQETFGGSMNGRVSHSFYDFVLCDSSAQTSQKV